MLILTFFLGIYCSVDRIIDVIFDKYRKKDIDIKGEIER